jgi:hypothetical protein
MMDVLKVLPARLALEDFTAVDPSFQYHWVWCTVFWGAKRATFGSRLFLDGAADRFETLLERRQRFAEAERWHAVVTEHFTKLVASNIDYLVANPAMPVPHALAQLAKLTAIDDAAVPAHFPELAHYAQQWDALVHVKPGAIDVREIPTKPDSVRNIILEGIRTVQCTDKIALTKKFGLLLGAMKRIDQVARRREFGPRLICAVLKQLPGRVWFIPFVIFNGTVAVMADFLSEDERRVWIRFESCALLVLQDCAEMLDRFALEKSKLAMDDHILRGAHPRG